MSLKERIDADLKNALLKKEERKVSTLRLLKSEIRYREIDEKKSFTDEDIIRTIRNMVKKREESILEYRKGNRPDLAEKEEEEIRILKGYLPPELSDEEVLKVIDEVLLQFPQKSPQICGPVVGKVMGILKGRVDGRRVRELVEKRLA
jgi:hypothetical protein